MFDEQINAAKQKLEEFHKELSEAFENEEKMEQLYATNITITIGSQTLELPFASYTVDILTEAILDIFNEAEA